MEKWKERDGSEIHPGTVRQGIGFQFFDADEAESSSKYYGFCVPCSPYENDDQTKKSLWPCK